MRHGAPRSLAAAAAGLAAACAVACAARSPRADIASASPAGRVSFHQVQEIFRDSCEHCHNADKAKGGLQMDSYETLLAGGEHGSPFVAGESASSRLVQMLEGAITPRMPYKEDPLPAAQVAVIRRWIDEGAPGPAMAGNATEKPDDPARELTVPNVRPAVPVAGAVAAVAFDPTGRRLAAGSYKAVHLMSFDDRKWIATIGNYVDQVRAVAFSPDGRLLAAAGGPSGRFGELEIWDVAAAPPRRVAAVRGHTDAILGLAFSPDGRKIATASYDKTIKLWDAPSGKELATLKEHTDAVYAVAFIAGGAQLVSAAGDRTLKLWDLSTGKRLFTVNDALDAVYTAAVDPAGSRIAAAGADRMIRTWSWNGGTAAEGPAAPLLESTFAHGDAVLRLAYSPDGSLLVSAGADRVIKVWDAATLREKDALEGQPDWVMGLALSPDGKWVAAGRYDGTVGVYPLAGGGEGEEFVVPPAGAPAAQAQAGSR